MRAFDVTWGDVEGDVVIENSYANVSRAVDHARRVAHRRRRARSRSAIRGATAARRSTRASGSIAGRWPICCDAFDIEDYPVDGLLSGDFHVYGPYTRPFGVRADDDRRRHRLRRAVRHGHRRACDSKATACGSTASRSTKGGGRDHRRGVRRLERHLLVQRRGPRPRGRDARLRDHAGPAAADRRCSTSRPSGSATFDEPRYDVRVGVHDLFFGEEGIGEVTGRLSVRDTVLTYELEAASPRLAVSGTGRIALDEAGDADMSFRVTDTSLDPYVRVFQPTLSPYTTAIASGTIRVVGELYNRDALRDRRRRSSSSICGCSTTACAIRVRFSCVGRGTDAAASTACGWSATTPRSTSTGSVDLRAAGAVAAGRRRRQSGGAAGLHAATCAARVAPTCRR